MARSTPALQRAAAVPLPETPAGALYSYTPKPTTIGLGAPSTPRTPASMAQTSDSPLTFTATAAASTSKTPRSIPLPETPEGARPYAVQLATPEQGERRSEMMSTPGREAFRSEMTTPVTGHRLLPTPRSALRSSSKPPMSANARRKSARGFLAPFLPAPPSTKRKSVVFDEQLYIQEIVDIRDKTMHWDERLDGKVEEKKVESQVLKQGARSSVFASPAVRVRRFTLPFVLPNA
ncbi:hypothetical protein BCR35DRAFT_119249 [Leucosporidium creatinivorum]|uniref:Uncharacterized protein n=1 Tax=Leucosporidium creatinivorum TaxID=106004 RepID=A0A1Y2EZC8_9BASI|nr:hypothetical protein BCR35DRAFT_119249 [Leucosporidium creatinivorum]